MIFIDYLLLAIVVASAVIGIFRGFVKEAMSLVSWVLAVWVSIQFGHVAAEWLGGTIDSYTLRLWGGRALLLVGTLFLGGAISWLISSIMDETGLSGTDRAVGILFGLARGVILAGIVVLLLEFAGFSESSWWQDSKLIPYAAPVADFVEEVAEEGIEYLDVDKEQVMDAASEKAGEMLIPDK